MLPPPVAPPTNTGTRASYIADTSALPMLELGSMPVVTTMYWGGIWRLPLLLAISKLFAEIIGAPCGTNKLNSFQNIYLQKTPSNWTQKWAYKDFWRFDHKQQWIIPLNWQHFTNKDDKTIKLWSFCRAWQRASRRSRQQRGGWFQGRTHQSLQC